MTLALPRPWMPAAWQLPAWFTDGKGQRNPANGKGKRKAVAATGSTVGKTPRNTATSGTGCCCCFGHSCSLCGSLSLPKTHRVVLAGTSLPVGCQSCGGVNYTIVYGEPGGLSSPTLDGAYCLRPDTGQYQSEFGTVSGCGSCQYKYLGDADHGTMLHVDYGSGSCGSAVTRYAVPLQFRLAVGGATSADATVGAVFGPQFNSIALQFFSIFGGAWADCGRAGATFANTSVTSCSGGTGTYSCGINSVRQATIFLYYAAAGNATLSPCCQGTEAGEAEEDI